MKWQGSLVYLLLALCLGSGEAGPLLSGGPNAGANFGIGHGLGGTSSHGVGEAVGQGAGEAASSGVREVMRPGVGDAINNGVREAVHALGNAGGEAGRQAENIIRHGIDAAHNSWQGVPGNNGAWPLSGGPGVSGSQGGFGGHSQGNPGGPGAPWGHGHPSGSGGNFVTNSQGGSWGQGGNGRPFSFGTNSQGAVAQPGYNSGRSSGSNPNTGCINPQPSGSGESSNNSGGSTNSQGSGSSNGGNSGGSSSGPNWDRPLESNRDIDRGSYSGSQGSNTGSSSSSSSGNGNKPECDYSGNEIRMSGGSGGQGFRGQGGPSYSGVREVSGEGSRILENSQGNYQNSPGGPFKFDAFWKEQTTIGNYAEGPEVYAAGPQGFNTKFLNLEKLKAAFRNEEFLNWHALFELKGLRSAAPDAK
ncbi:PREDICTED: dermokine [Chrysochloris asiatica]|uniref:Dermokine n=1 Tax=Chrysochloris asiatica TaxID=185453 RepID=A0A9B0TP68_CHRAS|nr:PREDICTED: dermokine [Chrysochloris asiatica]